MAGHIQIPIELLEQFERGNVLLFVGEGINRGVLPSAAEMAQELAERCDYPPEEPLTLPRVAGYYELTRDRHGLVQFLRDRLEKPGLAFPRSHKLVAQLRPPVVVTTCYDRLLERALREAGVPYVPVVGNAEVAYAEKDKVLLVWLWGVLDQPDSVVVTEDDRRLFLEGRANLSDVLRGEMAWRTWLFVGFDAEDGWFRAFYDSVNRGLDRQGRRAYIFGATPGAYTRAWWRKRNAEILGADVACPKPVYNRDGVETFLAALTEQLAARARPAPRPVPVTAEPLPLPEEPYKALVAYEAQDRALFFGRDREIEELTALVHAHRLVLLYGASGVGKTSLLQAGVIPRLEAADPGYVVVNVRALTDPADAIRTALRRKLPEAELPPDEVSLVDFLPAAVRATDRSLVVVIDQFEEFFIRLSPEFRAAFVAELGALYDARDLPVKAVLSLREDYLAKVSEIESRVPEVFRTKMRLLPLTREQAREAIACPVEALGYTYAPVLIDRLLDDLTREGVMPPQLQLVCGALFHHARAEGRQILTLADYETLGGAQGVLRGYLDQELHRFPPEEQALARDLLEELVTSERTKKVETLAELATALAAERAALSTVVEKLVRARLLHPLEREDHRTAYELAHEYLIREISLGAEAQARKEAEELIKQEVENWQRFGTLLAADKLTLVSDLRDTLRLTPKAQELLLRSALQAGTEVGYWLGRVSDPRRRVKVLDEAARSKLVAVRRRTAEVLGTQDVPEVVGPLLELALCDADPSVRTAAGQSLAKLVGQRATVVRRLQLEMDGAEHKKRRLVIEVLMLLPLSSLPVGLRIRTLVVRAHQRATRIVSKGVVSPLQRAAARIGVALLALVMLLYALSASSYYMATCPSPTPGEPSVVVVRRGFPLLKLPGLDQVVVDTGVSVSQVAQNHKRGLLNEWTWGLWAQRVDSGYREWGAHLGMILYAEDRISMLWYLDRAEGFSLLLEATGSDYPEAREWTASILGQVAIVNEELVPNAVEALIKLLEDEDEGVRSKAAETLGEVVATNPALATSQLAEALTRRIIDEEWDVQDNATEALAQVLTANQELAPQVAEALIKWLDDEEPQLRYCAANALRQMVVTSPALGTSQVAETLVRRLTDSNRDVRSTAAYAMGQVVTANPALTTPQVVAALDGRMAEERGYVYDAAVDALGQVIVANPALTTQQVTEELVEVYLRRMSSDYALTHSETANALGKIVVACPASATPQVSEMLTKLMKERVDKTLTEWELLAELRVRSSAAEALGQVVVANPALATSDSVEALVGLLTDHVDESTALLLSNRYYALIQEERSVYSSTVGALSQVVTVNPQLAPQLIEPLVGRLGDEDHHVRNSAVEALKQLVATNAELTPQVIDVLVARLTDESYFLRNSSAEALATVVATNPTLATSQTAELLVSLLTDEDSEVRNRVAYALVQSTAVNPALAAPPVAEALEEAIVGCLSNREDPAIIGAFVRIGSLEQDTAVNPVVATPQVLEALFRFLTDEDDHVRVNAVEALGPMVEANPALAKPEVAEALVGRLTDKYEFVRVYATEALGKMATANPALATPEMAEVLAAQLTDRSSFVRWRTVEALRQVVTTNPALATPQMTETLVKLLADSDETVRFMALDALVEVYAVQAPQPNGMSEMLFSRLTNPLDSQERMIAERALFLVALRNSPSLMPMRERLERLAVSREPHVRIAANETLAMLEIAERAHTATQDSEREDRARRTLRTYLEWKTEDVSLFGENLDWVAQEAPQGPFGENFGWAAQEMLQWLYQQTMEGEQGGGNGSR